MSTNTVKIIYLFYIMGAARAATPILERREVSVLAKQKKF
jgi:hypothetical protein